MRDECCLGSTRFILFIFLSLVSRIKWLYNVAWLWDTLWSIYLSFLCDQEMALNRVVGSCIKVEVANCTGQHQKKGGVFVHVFCYSSEDELRSINSAFIMVNIHKLCFHWNWRTSVSVLWYNVVTVLKEQLHTIFKKASYMPLISARKKYV